MIFQLFVLLRRNKLNVFIERTHVGKQLVSVYYVMFIKLCAYESGCSS